MREGRRLKSMMQGAGMCWLLQDFPGKDGLEEDIAEGCIPLHPCIIGKCCDEFSEREHWARTPVVRLPASG